MATQEIQVERRQHCREGVIGQLEDITYTALRKYRVIGEARTEQTTSSTETAAVN